MEGVWHRFPTGENVHGTSFIDERAIVVADIEEEEYYWGEMQDSHHITQWRGRKPVTVPGCQKYWSPLGPLHILPDAPLSEEYWGSGGARNAGTERDSLAILDRFVSFVRSNGNCDCKNYFLRRP